MARTHTIYLYDENTDEETEVLVAYTYTPGTPAKIYGPPENCYPAEEPGIDILSATAVETGAEVDIDLEEHFEELEENAVDWDAAGEEDAALARLEDRRDAMEDEAMDHCDWCY